MEAHALWVRERPYLPPDAHCPRLYLSFANRHVGELYTSAAPYDPLFWVIHPAAERLMGWRRKLAVEQPEQ